MNDQPLDNLDGDRDHATAGSGHDGEDHLRAPAPRVDGYAPLRSYAAIGDGRTVALIAEDGRIDWYPTPDLHSPPAFAAVLDEEDGGQVDLAPVDEYRMRRAYVVGTNVLVTTFVTATGTVRVTDSLNTGVAGRLPWSELGRRVEGVEGEVSMAWRVAPGTMFGERSPWVEHSPHGPVLRAGCVTVAVPTLGEMTTVAQEQDISGVFTTSPGSRHLVGLAATHDEPVHVPVPEDVDAGIDRTIANWRVWSREFHYDGPWGKAVQRSALALKLLIQSATGSVAAAATTSLPESWAGGKNWDYRYSWHRDTAHTVDALFGFGLREETHAAISWTLRTLRNPDMQVFYELDGSEPRPPRELDLPGWRGVGPVVDGNPAARQLQLGVYGDVMGVVRTYVDHGHLLDAETARTLAALADAACDAWRRPDSGMWELPELRHYTTSKLGCWQALRCAAHLAEEGHLPASPDRWAAEAERIRAWVERECWSPELQAYVMYPGSDSLDTSILLHAHSGFDRTERMSTTIDALRRELGHGPHLYRYTGMREEEGAFVACGFWGVAALAQVGRTEEARQWMDELLETANDVGIWTEMIDPGTGEFLGNLPQALSHLALIEAATALGSGLEGR
ncbi:glycoside hydrolase family 15 protein [Actinotalea sp. BY-33]|uniref:Glycoside hydrolase family 15 protein n=1 Tax=Actinotalea soli TaxID=2819234 RepID=A0A939LPF6_9CELL|nr:glycoside hydrolase family 15 protein [Actinotalea soli]MBO1751469.1 glycoside hydrolase family 15 protein [Actinotalea soli]